MWCPNAILKLIILCLLIWKGYHYDFFLYNILSLPSFIGSLWILGSYYFLVALNQYQDFFVFELFSWCEVSWFFPHYDFFITFRSLQSICITMHVHTRNFSLPIYSDSKIHARMQNFYLFLSRWWWWESEG